MTAVLPQATAASPAAFTPDDSTVSVTIAGLAVSDWPLLRDLRLAALKDAPSAFVTTAEDEERQLAEYWEAQFDRARWVVARSDGRIVGVAALAKPDAESPADSRYVEAVWVDPDYRNCGVLRTMIGHLESEAREQGAAELRLWVLDTNLRSAGVAYTHLSFRREEVLPQETKKWRTGPGSEKSPFVTEILMSKKL